MILRSPGISNVYLRHLASSSALAVALLFGAFAPQAGQADESLQIVAGKSVGPVSLGMNVADLYRALGDPDNVGSDGDFPDGKLYIYNSRGIQVTIDGSSVVQIIITGTQYATPQGVGVGATELRVSALLGDPSITKKYERECEGRVSGYHYPGLWIHFDCSGHVKEMRVWNGT